MRLMVTLPEPAAERLRDLTFRERRPIRHQAELLLELAVRDVPPVRGYEPPRPQTPVIRKLEPA
jgi:hypothetical protein